MDQELWHIQGANDVTRALHIENPPINAYLLEKQLNNPARFHPDLIRNDEALACCLQRLPQSEEEEEE